MEGDYQTLRREFESQKIELAETRRMLEQLKRENQLKTRECQEAWNSLKELQNELMRKSMHVGSLGVEIYFVVAVVVLYCSNMCNLLVIACMQLLPSRDK